MTAELSHNGLDFIKNWEKCRLNAYLDQAGIWTIAYGNIFYPDGTRVAEGDLVNQERADELFRWNTKGLAESVDNLVIPILTQNQIDSLVSLVYNIGLTAFKNSTLRKVINTTMEPGLLRDAFLMWNKIHKDGVLRISEGLRNRRIAEWKMFIS